MLHELELSRVGTHFAAWASDVDDPQRETAAAMCKGFVGEAANLVTAENIQIHGGVGFTWDVDAHLLYRRAKQNDVLFGNQAWHRRRLADIFLGRAGGTALANYAAAIGEVHAVRPARIELDHRPRRWRIGVEHHLNVVAGEPVVTGEVVACGIPGFDHPGTEVNVTRSA